MLFLTGFLFACKDNGIPDKVDGWKPVYKSEIADVPIESQDAKPIEKGGKIFVKGNLLFQVEEDKGIHVIDISNLQQPQRIGFISLGGASEIAVRDQYLYSNNYNDLVIIDISDIKNAKLTQRIANAFALNSPNTPPQPGYFECVDDSRGEVVDWIYTTLSKPKCKS